MYIYTYTGHICLYIDKSVTTSRFAKLMTDKDVVSRHRCNNANPVGPRRMALFYAGILGQTSLAKS